MVQEDLIYDLIINLVLVKRSMVLMVSDVITKVKQTFDLVIIKK